MAKKLTGKQIKFALAYIECLNATEAARRAGYGGDDASLGQIGHHNLKNVEIKRFIDEHLNEYIMSAHEVLYRLTEIARGDITDVIDEYGYLDTKKAVARGKSGLIKSVEYTSSTSEDMDTYSSKVAVYDKMDALKTLAKYHKILVNRIQVDDWRSEAIADIKAGRLTYSALYGLFGDETLVRELFASAGVPVVVDDDGQG